MSKYIKVIPLGEIGRISIVPGAGRSMAQVRASAGCDYIMNGGFYAMDTGKPTHHLKAEGAVLAKETWGCWGFAWDRGADISMAALPAERKNYIGAYELLSPMVGIHDRLNYGAELGGKRGRTALALTGDKLILFCSGDGTKDGATPEGLREELYRLGAETAIMLDGGGSSQCDFGGGEAIKSDRGVHHYICVWTKKEENKPVGRKTVCLDPGHGPGCVNGSPDGTYKEQEFAWDMAGRVRAHLERCGVRVVLTRDAGGYPSLTERADASNRAGADLFVSLHSNAAGNGGWNDSIRGLLVYTSAAGDSAGRNVAARAILARMREAGVAISASGLLHELYTVLVKATAPAVLVEYGFHTNKADVALLRDSAYREKLAEATAKGVCDFLGVAWKGGTPGADPWYAAAQKWAVEAGISDGTRPTDTCTRAEVWEMLRRLNS